MFLNTRQLIEEWSEVNVLSRHLTPIIGLFIAMWTLLQAQEPIHLLSQSN